MVKKVGKLRPLKDGSGFSICYSSDENVGKKRCLHQSGEAFVIKNNTIKDTSEISEKEAEKNVKTKVLEISKKLTKEEKEEILTSLRGDLSGV